MEEMLLDLNCIAIKEDQHATQEHKRHIRIKEEVIQILQACAHNIEKTQISVKFNKQLKVIISTILHKCNEHNTALCAVLEQKCLDDVRKRKMKQIFIFL